MNNKIFLSISVLTWVFLISLYVFWIQYISHRDYLIFKWLYSIEAFREIEDIYSESSSAQMLHNLGNTKYQQYQISGGKQDLQASNLYFSWSLQVGEDENTRYNYELTLQALRDIEENENNESSSLEKNDISETTQWNDTQQSQQHINQSNTENKQLDSWEEESQAWKELTWEERELIEQQIQILKNQQIQNQNFFWKRSGNIDTIDDVFENFFWTIDRWEERDW